MFVEEGEGGALEKRAKTNRGEGIPSMCVRCFFKKNTEIFQMKFYTPFFFINNQKFKHSLRKSLIC